MTAALTNKEYAAYQLLLAAHPAHVTVRKLCDALDYADPQSARVIVYKLRVKLGADKIATVLGVGFRLIEPVEVRHREFVIRNGTRVAL